MNNYSKWTIEIAADSRSRISGSPHFTELWLLEEGIQIWIQVKFKELSLVESSEVLPTSTYLHLFFSETGSFIPQLV